MVLLTVNIPQGRGLSRDTGHFRPGHRVPHRARRPVIETGVTRGVMMRKPLLIGLALMPVVAVGCGDDDGDAVTHDEWFQAICEKQATVEFPDFDQFFADHPEPTLDDWAAFLPQAVTAFEQFIDAIDSTPRAPDDEAGIDAVVAAMTKVRDNFADAQEAAEAGDQTAFDAAEAKNQDTDIPAWEAAMGAVETRDCPGQGG
jgi:hypothetical protein